MVAGICTEERRKEKELIVYCFVQIIVSVLSKFVQAEELRSK